MSPKNVSQISYPEQTDRHTRDSKILETSVQTSQECLQKDFRKIYLLEPKILNSLVDCTQTDGRMDGHTDRTKCRADLTRGGSSKNNLLSKDNRIFFQCLAQSWM